MVANKKKTEIEHVKAKCERLEKAVKALRRCVTRVYSGNFYPSQTELEKDLTKL
tara:strand:+ start:773 stop:934 length:162 start_codon:yes stop_codon:yes gene_type:complete